MKKRKVNVWDIFWILRIIKEVSPRKRIRYFNVVCVKCWVSKDSSYSFLSLTPIWCICTKSPLLWSNGRKPWFWSKLIRENNKLYKVYFSIKSRCNNINTPAYKNYWGRWITYDPKWNTFEWFCEDMIEWYKDHLTIDREDNNWNYCKENCRWITNQEQQRNKRNNINLKYKWELLVDICNDKWLDYRNIVNRVTLLWWDMEKAVNTPIREKRRNNYLTLDI